jgi:hypothetical protein
VVSNSTEIESLVDSKPSKDMPIEKNDVVNYYSAITYQALSRGSFIYIEISESNISISEDKNLMEIDKYLCKSEDWEALNALLVDLNRDTFQTLKAPTDKRLFDGAAHATLALRQGDVEIRTPSFDHGFPPESIEVIVNKVLSIKENAIKN